MIGTRLEKPNVMDYQEIVATKDQNTPANGYGSTIQNSLPKLFADFYEENCLDYNETIKLKESLPNSDKERFTRMDNEIFDNYVYYKRLAISFDTLLLEANYRAMKVNKTAYLHVVGLGLGVWKISPHQNDVYLDTFVDRAE